MTFTSLFWILLIVAAVFCAIGFYRFVWFMSVGYGLAVAGIGLALGIYSLAAPVAQPNLAFLITCILLIVYGSRLGLFLLIRELKNAGYKKAVDANTGSNAPFFVKIVMWIACAFLYVAECAGPMYRMVNEKMPVAGDVAQWIGVVIMLLGIIIEALADKQKSAQKKTKPDMPAMEGLFKMCRCPNYFGEILFWTGTFVTGVSVYAGAGQWIVAILGYICIFYVMISGAKRLEKRHIKNYGEKAEYQIYANKTPILITLIPIYHLVKEEKK